MNPVEVVELSQMVLSSFVSMKIHLTYTGYDAIETRTYAHRKARKDCVLLRKFTIKGKLGLATTIPTNDAMAFLPNTALQLCHGVKTFGRIPGSDGPTVWRNNL